MSTESGSAGHLDAKRCFVDHSVVRNGHISLDDDPPPHPVAHPMLYLALRELRVHVGEECTGVALRLKEPGHMDDRHVVSERRVVVEFGKVQVSGGKDTPVLLPPAPCFRRYWMTIKGLEVQFQPEHTKTPALFVSVDDVDSFIDALLNGPHDRNCGSGLVTPEIWSAPATRPTSAPEMKRGKAWARDSDRGPLAPGWSTAWGVARRPDLSAVSALTEVPLLRLELSTRAHTRRSLRGPYGCTAPTRVPV